MGLVYQETGVGEPLLLIHGMGSASSAWKLITPILAKNFKVISIDLPAMVDLLTFPANQWIHIHLLS